MQDSNAALAIHRQEGYWRDGNSSAAAATEEIFIGSFLAGELRACNFLENRIAEAEKLGFTKCIIPASSRTKLKKFDKIEVCAYHNIREVLQDL